MKKDFKHRFLKGKAKGEWMELAQRYFEGETNEEEEKQLRIFLNSPLGKKSEFEELRAVMSFLSEGKSLYVKKKTASRSFYRKAWTAAAIVFLCLCSGATGYIIHQQRNICVAYIYGEKCTDVHTVMQRMQYALKGTRFSGEETTVEHQLNEMFHTLDEPVATINDSQ